MRLMACVCTDSLDGSVVAAGGLLKRNELQLITIAIIIIIFTAFLYSALSRSPTQRQPVQFKEI